MRRMSTQGMGTWGPLQPGIKWPCQLIGQPGRHLTWGSKGWSLWAFFNGYGHTPSSSLTFTLGIRICQVQIVSEGAHTGFGRFSEGGRLHALEWLECQRLGIAKSRLT